MRPPSGVPVRLGVQAPQRDQGVMHRHWCLLDTVEYAAGLGLGLARGSDWAATRGRSTATVVSAVPTRVFVVYGGVKSESSKPLGPSSSDSCQTAWRSTSLRQRPQSN